MPNWKKVIVSGSNAILNNITASGDISASGDIYATNFYGTASIASAVNVQALNSPGFFDVLFTNGSNLFLTDSDTNDFTYNPSTNTLVVDNIIGTASLATTSSYALTASLATTSTTSSYALTASYVEGAVSINGNTNNNILTATGTDTIQGESNLTFNGSTLNINGGITVNPQGYLGFIDLSATPGGASVNIGDENQSNNGTFFKVDDENSNITFNFDDPTITHTFDSTGLNITGSLTVDTIVNVNTTHITASGNIKSSGNISASGDVYADNVRTDTIIFPNVGGKITTPDGQINDDYVTLDGTNRYFSVVLDATDLLKVDFNNELITLGESTKHGSATNDTHQFTGSVDIKGAITASALSASYVDFDITSDASAPAYKEGRVYYNAEDGALTVYNDKADISLQVGQEFWVRVKNNSGGDILNGTPVYISGSQGDRPTIFPATAQDHISNAFEGENHIIGVVTHDILDTEEGYATAQGIVRGVDTTAFNAGDTLYIQTGSPATPEDYYRTTPPPYPYDTIRAGWATKIGSNGFIFVEPKTPTHLFDINDISGSAFNAEVGDILIKQSGGGLSYSKILSGSYTINDGDLTVEGDIIAQQYIVNSTVTNVTMSFSSGSTIFGDSLDDTHLFTGSVNITGSLDVSTSITGSALQLGNLGAENEILIVGANTEVTSSNLLAIDTVNERVGIGTSTPQVKLDLVGESSGEAQVRVAQHDDTSDGPDIRFFKSHNTAASPSAVANNDYIGAVNAFAYDGSTYIQSGFFGFQADGTDGDSKFGLRTRVDGTLTDRITIDAAGDVDVAGQLSINGFNDVSASLANLISGGGADDLGNHTATQDLDMAGFSISASLNITASGNISASGYVSADHLILNPNTTTTGSSDTDAAVDISLGDEEYKRGVIKRVFNFREVLANDINISDRVIADVGDFKKGTFNVTFEIYGWISPGTESADFNNNTASINQNFHYHSVSQTQGTYGSPVDIFYGDDLTTENNELSNLFQFIPGASAIPGIVTGNNIIKAENNQLKFNPNNIDVINSTLSGSLLTIYLDYQLYK